MRVRHPADRKSFFVPFFQIAKDHKKKSGVFFYKVLKCLSPLSMAKFVFSFFKTQYLIIVAFTKYFPNYDLGVDYDANM